MSGLVIDEEKQKILDKLSKATQDFIDLPRGEHTYDIVRHLCDVTDNVALYGKGERVNDGREL